MPGEDDTESELMELWPTKFLEKKIARDAINCVGESVALIILNSPIAQYEYFDRLYHHAGYVICADGGANCMHDLVTEHFSDLGWTEALHKALPDTIHGDLDSLNDEVRKRYHSIGVHITRDPDQYSTDFGKAIKKVYERLPKVQDVLVLGSVGGRVDQGIGLLAELYREQMKKPEVRFWLFSEASITTLLQSGSTLIHTPLKDGLIKKAIGILPLYGPATISTEGLEWDVKDWPTEMGGQMSTSNYIVADSITISTDREVLFTVERAVGR